MTIELIFENLEYFIFNEEDFDNFYLSDITKEYSKPNHYNKLHEYKIAHNVQFTLKKTANNMKFSGFQNILPFERILESNDIRKIRIGGSEEKEYEIAWFGDIYESNLAQTTKIIDGNLVVHISKDNIN